MENTPAGKGQGHMHRPRQRWGQMLGEHCSHSDLKEEGGTHALFAATVMTFLIVTPTAGKRQSKAKSTYR